MTAHSASPMHDGNLAHVLSLLRFRRVLGRLCLAAGLAAVQVAVAQPQFWGPPVGPRPESEALARSVPIADVHLHYNPVTQTPRFLLRLMDENLVRWGGAVGDHDPALAELLGPRLIQALGQAEFTRVLASDGPQALLDAQHPTFVRLFEQAEVMLSTGQARGFGEIHISNVGAVGAARSFERKIPLDSPVLRRFYETAHKHKGFVQIHYDRDGDTVAQILAMARRYPDALTLVSHCLPKSTPDDMRRLFEGAPNIMCELSGATPLHGVDRIITRDGIRAGWLQLVEDFPDRVMLGTDPCCGLTRRYGEIVELMRTRALAAMRPDTLEKVAYRNAVRVFGLQAP